MESIKGVHLAIVGVRLKGGTKFSYEQFEENMKEYILREGISIENLTIVSGGAPGVDQYAELWANKHGCKTIILKPDWKNKGNRAGLERNTDIVKECSRMIAFPDLINGRGTQDSIRKCKEANKPCFVIPIKN